MKTKSLSFALISFFAILVLSTSPLRAALTIATGLGTTHTNNIVLNGSFENPATPGAAPPNGSQYFWANPSQSPYVVPDDWTGNGGGDSATWGNDGGVPRRLKASDVLPDGRLGMSFHTDTGTTVNQPPTFNPNGQVTFPSPPTFTPAFGKPPVILKQTVHTELFPMPSYNLSFWISGEEISTVQGFNQLGIIGFQMSNVVAGNPIEWLTVPNGPVGGFGSSHLYEYTFTPINPSLPVDIRFINWGGMNLTAWGGSPNGVQPILDDVIVNAVPEPSSWIFATVLMIGLFSVGLFGKNRDQKAT